MKSILHKITRLASSIDVEIWITFCITLILFLVFVEVDAFEKLVHLSVQYEHLEVDEFLTFLMLSSIAFMILTFRNLRRIKRENESRKIAEHKAHQLAFYDSLTGLPNRALCIERLQHLILQAKRNNVLLGVLFIDLDHFKTINDSFGHHAGDLVLQQVAARFKSTLRQGDTLARISGDEFIVVLQEMENPRFASTVAQKLLAILEQGFDIETVEVSIGCSIGIATYPLDGNEADELIKHADTAMYHAKRSGRNIFRFFAADMNLIAKRKILIISRLRQALERDAFYLLYQPQIDLQSGKVVAVEALIRWQDEELGNISPTEFIPLAEENGLIILIGEWVLREACTQLKIWQTHYAEPIKVSVNMSAMQLKQENFAEKVEYILRKTGLAARFLELELTETAIMNDPNHAIKTLTQLKALGVTLALDDFGTGYSSLNCLQKLSLDKLKIDKSFLDNIHQKAEDVTIVRATVILAQSLSIEVTAEGVESLPQLEILRQFPCQYVQGFYFSKPILPGEVLKLLQSEHRFT
ncbi:putative bifunctional diguanylate cyclase/phosphodiesterase [Aliikangiella maris]|uniref:EAL domain-containing protein n=2 Tax=Aliikangiella maris TaxID=3162458 RepID=A0ABV2BT38_9GAMM